MNQEHWHKAKQIYQSAIELGPQQREAFLVQACGHDDLLRQEVESLLACHPEAEHFMESPALDAAARALAQEQSREPEPNLSGRSLLHYRLEEKIGAGGMGVVYRAQDTKLDRRVAIKLLPDLFSSDPERLARFEREARMLAALNHPNIAAIHGLEQAEGKRFLVLELVEGETLAQRIGKKPIPMDEALELCRQIAEGLEAAHEKGVLHRDLKPANIAITPEGKVKILDFGLAKAFHPEAAAADIAPSPTLKETATRTGVILGTAAYMSPEQAKGKAVDKRTDIWAFGCVLFECLTGRKAFPGETISDVVASILRSEPDWTLLPEDTPLFVRAVLRQCLQKDPHLRLHDIADARIEMREEPAELATQIPAARRWLHGWWIAACATAAIMAFLAGLAVMKYSERAVSSMPQSVIRTTVRLDPGFRLAGRGLHARPARTAIALSSDGRFIVYVAVKENRGTQDKPQLYLRELDRLEARPITGTEGGISPFLSPDDRWIGFWANGKLMKIPVQGGMATALCDVESPFGFSWGTDGRIVFTSGEGSGLSRISAEGGQPETLTKPDASQDEYSHRLPHSLPDGKGILFTLTKSGLDVHPRVALLELGTGKWRVLLEESADARYVPAGYLAFLRQGKLMTVPFDAVRLEITGQAVPAVAAISQALNAGNSTVDTGAGQFSISASGSIVYAPGGVLPDAQNSLVWVDQRGNAEPITSLKAPFFAPRLSPDGQRIAYCTLGMDKQVWIYDLNRGTNTRVTSEGSATYVIWTPDGKRALFGWGKTGPENIFRQVVDGSSPMERLTRSDNFQTPSSCSPDGQTLAFVEGNKTGYAVMLLKLADRQVTLLMNSRFVEGNPEFSPDGRWLAYTSIESRRKEVYVQSFPDPGGRWQISAEGGDEPLWARNGKQLFFRGTGLRYDQVWVVDVQSGSGFAVGKPRLLFEKPGYHGGSPVRGWDISPDGKLFLMMKSEERKSEPITEMIFVQNWFEELKRLAPTGK